MYTPTKENGGGLGNFVLLCTTNRNDTREDEQGNKKTYTKALRTNLMCERRQKATELRKTDKYTMDSRLFAVTSWDRVGKVM